MLLFPMLAEAMPTARKKFKSMRALDTAAGEGTNRMPPASEGQSETHGVTHSYDSLSPPPPKEISRVAAAVPPVFLLDTPDVDLDM
ncbi:hypothetical protein K7X08_011804 [Anisodus acutangulus]|uniref:Uncharacterized protein n=1 Tax=Anisodus acutangulus TaxID=402998 RepID=A0A9Q1MKH9_9SOLA|nr:hypothetical protein K7X08_011804 [Anisodus acutangulus]